MGLFLFFLLICFYYLLTPLTPFCSVYFFLKLKQGGIGFCLDTFLPIEEKVDKFHLCHSSYLLWAEPWRFEQVIKNNEQVATSHHRCFHLVCTINAFISLFCCSYCCSLFVVLPFALVVSLYSISAFSASCPISLMCQISWTV